MNYTTNYHLPQWVESDRIMREDFNQMCADIDGGLAAAQTTADTAYCPTNKPYAVGSYTGNRGTKTVNLGFRPSFLIICGDKSSSTPSGHSSSLGDSFGIITANHNYGLVTLTDTGFQVTHDNNLYPQLNDTVDVYVYIAFR